MPRPVSAARGAIHRLQAACAAPEKWLYARGILSPASLTLPDFLGIGAQKGGTSWLWENLRRHPDLYLPDQKEIHYFDRRFHRSLRFYARKFRAAGGRVKGEITPAYGSLPACRVRLIARVLPRLRVVLLLRNPVDRAWSHAQMQLFTKQAVPRDGVSEADFLAHFQGRDSREKGDYLAILNTWEAAFPADQILIAFFEQIQEEPWELLRSIFRHLGVRDDLDPAAFPLREVVNRGGSRPMPAPLRAFLEELYAPQIARLRQRFGDRVAAWSPIDMPAGGRLTG